MMHKAYIVEVEDYQAEIIYAESAGKAKGRGCTEYDFIERKVRRAPELDQYFLQGGPTRADLLENGWWFECEAKIEQKTEATPYPRFCAEHATKDGGGGIIDGKVLCWRHNFKPGPIKAYRIGDGDGDYFCWTTDPQIIVNRLNETHMSHQRHTAEDIVCMEPGDIAEFDLYEVLCASVDAEWLENVTK